jgi:hypothetical protein
MTLKLTAARYAELHDKMTQHLGQRVREMSEPPAKQSVAQRMYPHLTKPKSAEEDQPKRQPIIQGWSHLRKPSE